MSNAQYCWAVIGGREPGVYWNCPHISCGCSSLPLPFTIQCVSLDEAKRVLRTLQRIVSPLQPQPSHQELLTAFNNTSVRGLLEDGAGFYAVSARMAEGSFQYLKTRHTQLFWEALTFLIVKGISDCMPPLLTAGEIGSDSPQMPSDAVSSMDELGDMLQTLSVTPSSPSLSSLSSLTHSSPHRLSTPPSTSEVNVSPLIYSHVHNLHGIISSNYYRMPTSQVEDLSQPLGPLAAQYLVLHGYGTSAITTIVQTYRLRRSDDQFTLDLARGGMAVAEARFLLVLIAQYN
ncbi:hypothetical protein SCLCIDRAFT_135300 [Scleroderma citrinum Foug A]|uniref:Uncharacterized protein n=1 Tax=Scleroderma citrinum Foug A TaxID=1036808 RepID=A0A0C2ZRE6_9AGAM|nr:hypothetical protein SCLCIDRAFT_135300 [Scleroderma citrinum Foug A]